MRLGREFYFLILLIALMLLSERAGADASAPAVFISEIAWMGTTESANSEWIELKNDTGSEVSLDGWKLEAKDGQPKINLTGIIAPGGYFLLERTNDDTVPRVSADQIYTGALGNSGEYLELKDAGGNVVDLIDATAGWPGGDNTSKQTLERKDNTTWSTGVNAGGTPKAPNSCIGAITPPATPETPAEPPISPPPSASSTPVGQTPGGATAQYIPRLGDVVINELVSDPSDEDVEWVELYNAVSRDIDLTGWTITEGSGAKTQLSGKISKEGAGKFIVIEKPKGSLNNSGDIVILRDNSDNTIDQVAYGDWDDGDKSNNAPAAGDPDSIARKMDGYNTYNNANDFEVTKKITKGASNIIEKAVSGEEDAAGSACGQIMFSEIYPEPPGEDNDEFIELYNSGGKEVDLSGWKIEDESKGAYTIKAGAGESEPESGKIIVGPGEHYVINRKDSKIALNNDSESLKLYEAGKDKACKTVKYEKAFEGMSYAFNPKDKAWTWTEIVTPGKENIIKKANTPPAVDFTYPKTIYAGLPVKFDSSDTVDEDSDALKFFWDFGDESKNYLPSPEHVFLKSGSFRIKLSVNDGKATSTKEKIIKVLTKGEKTEEEKSNAVTLAENQPGVTGIKINEIFPNPLGNDLDGEFIELWNSGAERANLASWIMRDSSASGKYQFKDDFWLEPDSFFAIKRTESGLTLNNDNDTVKLFNDVDKLMEEASYGGAIESASYARGENGKWFWTTRVTPGKKNIIAVADIKDKNLGVSSGGSGAVKGVKTTSVANVSYSYIDLSNLPEVDIGEKVRTRGIVAVEPGILGSQFFYIASEIKAGTSTVAWDDIKKLSWLGLINVAWAEADGDALQAGSGIQVYNYKKEFPNLKLGDLVEVNGEISESDGERRIKTTAIEDMNILKHGEPPRAAETGFGELDNLANGQLVKVSGEVTGKKGSTIYIDDGNGEMIAYIKKGTGIKMALIKEGDQVELTGILNQTKSGLRILPRYPSDIAKVETGASGDGSVEVVGEVPPGTEWDLAQRDRKMEMFKYLLIIAGAVIVVLLGWLVRILRKKGS